MDDDLSDSKKQRNIKKIDSVFLEPYSRNLKLCFTKIWTWLPESFATGDQININHRERHK